MVRRTQQGVDAPSRRAPRRSRLWCSLAQYGLRWRHHRGWCRSRTVAALLSGLVGVAARPVAGSSPIAPLVDTFVSPSGHNRLFDSEEWPVPAALRAVWVAEEFISVGAALGDGVVVDSGSHRSGHSTIRDPLRDCTGRCVNCAIAWLIGLESSGGPFRWPIQYSLDLAFRRVRE